MFGFFKNILRKQTAAVAEDHSPANGDEQVVETPEPKATLFHNHKNAGHHGNGHSQNSSGSGIELPLEPILKGLPLELQPRVKDADVGAATIYIPLEKILAQLSRGVVNISFGELRRAAPELFHGGADRDAALVQLPLGDIISRLNPALIIRRRAQRPVEVPAEISSPFQARGQGLIFSVAPTKQEPVTPPAARNGNRPALTPGLANRNNITSSSAPVPPGSPQPKAPSLPPSKRFDAKQPPAPIQMKSAGPVAHVKPAAPAIQIKPAGPQPLMVGLASLAEGWPEVIRQEIVQLNLVESNVGLPSEAVERALKQGRIAFTWKMLRSWVRPSPLPAVSAHDGTVLELPLKVVAPLFIARQSEAAKSQQKICIDENIPNLFFGFPQPEPASGAPAGNPAVTEAVDTNYYVWDDSSDTVRVDESQIKRNPTPGTSFVSRYATPNEIVSRAAALDGVAGALIALPDGLMVASRLSPELNGETLAAFLPQIFGKVSQCTKELRMGDLNNLNFTVGNTPWKIFRVNAIFFAALGVEGMPLPTGQLAAMAAELDHKPK